MGLHKGIDNPVGKGCKNNRSDLAIVLALLGDRRKSPYYQRLMSDIALPELTDTNIEAALIEAIIRFQTKVQRLKRPDGKVDPNGSTIYFLGGVRRDGKQIIVELDDQNLYAYDGKNKKYSFHSTSGDAKHPTGTQPQLFHIFRKHKTYRSRKYDAQMDYAMFFTRDGKAIHKAQFVTVTSVLKDIGFDYFGSHGCVRLSDADAKNLFEWAPMNTPVFIDMA